MHSSIEEHLDAVNRTLRFLKETPQRSLYCEKNEIRDVVAYTDVDQTGCFIDRMLTWRIKKLFVVLAMRRQNLEQLLREFVSCCG